MSLDQHEQRLIEDDKPLLILMVGLPRSGKSTAVARLRLIYKEAVVVRQDSVRLAMHGHRYQEEAEELISAFTRIMVKSLFMAGHSVVILDETSLSRSKRARYKSALWRSVYVYIDTPLDECIRRAYATSQPDLALKLPSIAATYEPLEPEDNILQIEFS